MGQKDGDALTKFLLMLDVLHPHQVLLELQTGAWYVSKRSPKTQSFDYYSKVTHSYYLKCNFTFLVGKSEKIFSDQLILLLSISLRADFKINLKSYMLLLNRSDS